MLVDAHCHLHEIGKSYDFIIIAVSDDLESSRKTLSLAGENVIPCIGIHPWEVDTAKESDLSEIEKIADRVRCLGEIGLDKRRSNYKKQMEFFRRQLLIAKDLDLSVNLHSLDSWREVLELLDRYEIRRANFHWYTGPLELLEEIEERGYFISINPAVSIQRKHMDILRAAPVEILLTESDAPYVYRGIELKPEMIKDVIKIIAKEKSMLEAEVEGIVYKNAMKFIG
ncbi:MAG: TatD family hydrolase [Candidatus Methanodesulfokora sp.]|jgi:TatD DNase family protein